MLRLISAITILMWALAANAGQPVVRTFSRAEYGAGAQNWAVAQDSLGRMYFGNRYGLLTYDSQTWELLRIPNYSTVRSIMIDDAKGRIYVGASDDFGYFEVERGSGRRVYRSLRQTLKSSDTRFSEIWNIHRDKNDIWFQSDFHIFRYDGDKTVTISFDDKITSSAIINGRLYAGLQTKGLVTVNDRSITHVADVEKLTGKRIVAILPGRDDRIVALTAFDGIYEVTPDGIAQPDLPINTFLKDNQAFSGAYNAKTGQYAFGTVNAGAVITKSAKSTPIHISVATGMQNNTVLNLGFDQDSNLWMALDNGIDYAITNSAVSILTYPGTVYGAGYASLLRDATLYLGTNHGLYAFKYPHATTTQRESGHQPLIKGQIWSIDTIGSDLLVSGDAGLYQGSATRGFQRLENISGTWCVRPIPGDGGRAIASGYDGFHLLQKTASGKWMVSNRIAGHSNATGKFIIDSNGDIWIAHWMRGIYRLRMNRAMTTFDSENLFNTHHGLPSDRNNLISMIDGELVFSTENGFYRFEPKRSRFEPHEMLNTMFRSRRSARLYQSAGHEVWSVSPDHVWRATSSPAGGHDLDTTTYQPLGEKLIPGFDNLQFISSGRSIMSSQDGFYEINSNYTNPSPTTQTLFISHIYAKQDSLIYTAPLTNAITETLDVPYALNSLKFEFTAPEYRAANAVRYSFLLENYDDGWSSWSRSSSKEYTQLSEGTYTLRVRAFDTYSGETAETSFSFAISAPWYRTTLAKVIYLLLFCAAGYVVYMLLRDSSRRAAREVERRKEEELEQMKRAASEEALRKDYEIAQLKSQQLEHDIKHKSEELSNITMNVIRKNEILLDISGKLDKVRDSIPDDASATVGRQLQKIKKLIQDSISHDDDWRSFTKNFDIVYENYTQRLLALHPDLNASDQRICCYLKIGLSSKEIAPLFNISYRSVEMTRYRLRKKMGLSREVNLTEYLQKI